VGDQLTLQELQKASTNLSRISEFLAVRSRWHLELDGFEALQDIDGSAERLLRKLDVFLDALGLRPDWSLPEPLEQLPTSRFDSGRLTKLASFMTQLSLWFDGQLGSEVESGGELHIGDMHRTLQSIRSGVEPIIDASPFRESVPETHPPSSNNSAAPPGAGAASRPPAMGLESGSRQLVGRGGVAAVDRLVLFDTDDQPITQTFRDDVELTGNAKQMISEFLDKHGVQYSGYQLHKFEDEVLRRVTGSPEGQVLVLKIGGFQDNPKPFFSYVPKVTQEASMAVELPPADAEEPPVEVGDTADDETASAPEASPAEPEPPSEPTPGHEFTGDDSDLFHDDKDLFHDDQRR